MAAGARHTGVEVRARHVIIAGRTRYENRMTDVFTHPWLGGLFGDPRTQELMSPERMLAHMLAVEAAYARALGDTGLVDPDIATQTADQIVAVTIDTDALRQGTASDGVVVPALVRSLRAALPKQGHAALHKGMTSQDVTDTATVLTLKPVCALFSERLQSLISVLTELKAVHGGNFLMGRTRMQAALPITVADRIDSWTRPLADHLDRLDQQKDRLLRLQLGGAVGTRHAMGGQGDEIATLMAQELGLNTASPCWHTDRSAMAEFTGWLSLVTGSLGKIGQDIALMAQQGINEIRLSGGGGSSAMPHKQNPVLAELLVTLARFNATLVPGMHHALVHEQERSGTAWALEWMILPQSAQATGRALTATAELLGQIQSLGARDQQG